MQVITIGLDLAKHVFQVHGVDQEGNVDPASTAATSGGRQVLLVKLPPCLVGMEACSTAHHWARELIGLGHEVRLMPPAYVKPYVKRGKNDAADAEAICEAVTRPTMRFVPIKSAEQQAVLVLHRAARTSGPPAHDAGQRPAGALCRVRHRRRPRHGKAGRAARQDRG